MVVAPLSNYTEPRLKIMGSECIQNHSSCIIYEDLPQSVKFSGGTEMLHMDFERL